MPLSNTFFPEPSAWRPEPDPVTSLQALGITSEQEATELESDLGVRFDDFTPEDCETWVLQTVYLDQFSRTRAVSLAADNAGVSIRTARQWQTDNILGFNQRLEIAVLRYTDVLEVMLFRRAQEPGSPPSLLMMLLRAHMPEKYGSARRSSAPRDDNPTDHHCDHDPQSNSTSQYDRELLEAVFQDLQNLKQFTRLSEGEGQSLPHTRYGGEGEDVRPNPTPKEPPSAGADAKLAHDPSAHSAASPPTPSPALGENLPRTQYGGRGERPEPGTQNPEPALNRRQRRELQRRAKRQKSHLARAPN